MNFMANSVRKYFVKEKISKLLSVYKKNDLRTFIRKCYRYFRANYMDKLNFNTFIHSSKYRKQFAEILRHSNYDRIILWRSSFGYNVELFQRPQHIANNLAKQSCLVLYEVTTMTDNVSTFREESKNLILVNFNNIRLNKIVSEELEKIDCPKFVDLYSTDWKLSVNDIKKYMSKGYIFIYEYIDHISAELAGTYTIPQNIIDKYNFAMGNTNVVVVVTAEKLKDDVISKRGKINLISSSNGVDYDFFQHLESFEFEENFINIINESKPILCYYGAMAKWFDYSILKELSDSDKYIILLFGIKYDTSYDENHVDSLKNVYFLGPRNYKVLKYYANAADVLMIPFLINDITKATSPVKLFEYMAMHKPIVTTAMPECKKYKSVIIANSKEDFLDKVAFALDKKNDKDYICLLDDEARANDWSQKTADILNAIDLIEY